MPFSDSSSSQAKRDLAHLLSQAGTHLNPRPGAQDRVGQMLRARLRTPRLLEQARDVLAPAPAVRESIWARALSSIDPLRHLSLWDRLRQSFSPATDLRSALWNTLAPRLQPAHQRILVSRPVKWVAAFALIIVAVRGSPLLFLAPASIAGSSVTLLSEKGDVQVLSGSFWLEPLRGRTELPLTGPTAIQTMGNGATVIDHDDGVLRFDVFTRGQFLDLSDRPEESSQETTFALEDGQIWMLGLVPKHVRGIGILTDQGRVVIHEGSVSVRQESGKVIVRVFDRSATVFRHGTQIGLLAGQQIVLTKDNDLLATKMDLAAFQEPWVAKNLSRDAAHQREIAQLQQERRAASAGILPRSAFYPVKRLAEKVDVLMSFSQEERARKLIGNANTRLNEAAALLQTGDTTDAESALREYKDTLLQVASGSGDNLALTSLLQKEVVDAGAATVSASLPGDPSYALKLAVDETIAALPSSVTKPDLEGERLLDALYALKEQVARGEKAVAREKLSQLNDTIAELGTGSLSLVSADIRQEAKALADQVAAAVEGPAQGVALSLGAPEKEQVLPQHPSRISSLLKPLSPEQVTAKAQEIRGRVFLFSNKKAQYTALEDQIRLLNRNPDRGRILRELMKSLPATGLAQRVAREIRSVQQQVEQKVTESGGTASARN